MTQTFSASSAGAQSTQQEPPAGSSQRSLFDAAESRRRRDEGIARAAEGREGWLARARVVAVAIASHQGTASADDLRAYGLETPPNTSPNIWGSIFNDKRFVFDHYVHSTRPAAHSNLIRAWRLAGAFPVANSETPVQAPA